MVLACYGAGGCSKKGRLLKRGMAWRKKTLSTPRVVAAVFADQVVTFSPTLEVVAISSRPPLGAREGQPLPSKQLAPQGGPWRKLCLSRNETHKVWRGDRHGVSKLRRKEF